MADSDSDGQELTFSEQKNVGTEHSKEKRKGKHAISEKERLKKRGNSKPGRAVVISGGSTKPQLDDVPVDLSADHKDLVMEYSDIFEPSEDAGFIDIQDGDAISESSDTEVVAHTREEIQYDNSATSSQSDSENEGNEGPPPLNSDEDDDEGSDVDGIDGPPPLDSDENAENTDNGDELVTSPGSGSREELSTRRAPVPNKRRGVKSSDNSDSDSEREVPPPLDSEDDGEESDSRSPVAETAESANVDSLGGYAHDSPEEGVNDDDNDGNDDEQPGGNFDDDDDDDDDDDEEEEEEQPFSNEVDAEDGDNDNDDKKEEEDAEVVPQSPQPVTPDSDHSEEGELSDSSPEAEAEIPQQNQSDDPDDDVEDDKESDNEVVLDIVGNEHVSSVADEVSSSLVPVEESHEDEKKESEDEGETGDTVGSEFDEKGTVKSVHDHNVSDSSKVGEVRGDHSDQESDESQEFVPIEDDNELEWDVEDFDVPELKTVKRTSKVNREVQEVDQLKKTFLDTLKSEAEGSKVVRTEHKAETKTKVDKGVREKKIPEDDKKRALGSSKDLETKDLKAESGKYSRKVTKDNPGNTEPVKVEKKSVKDGVKDESKTVLSSKVVDNVAKPTKGKVKATDKNLDETNKQKTEKFKKANKESQKVTKTSAIGREGVSKAGNVKSASVSSLPTGADVQPRNQPTKEKKKTRPGSDLRADSPSHNQADEVHLAANQPKKEVKKPRKSDSDSTSDSLRRKKPQKTTSSESLSSKKQKSTSASSFTREEREKSSEKAEVRKIKSKRTVGKPDESDQDDGIRRERKKRSDAPVKNPGQSKSKPRGRPTSNGHLSNSQEKISFHSGHHDQSPKEHGSRDHLAREHVEKDHSMRDTVSKDHNARNHGSRERIARDHGSRENVARDHGGGEHIARDHGNRDHVSRDRGTHKHSGHTHDRSKHVWLCRDDEIHKLIAQKASLLKEYESGSLAGRKVFSGHKSRHKREEDPADLPDVGFVSSKSNRRQTRPISEVIPDGVPYSSRRKDKRRSLQLSYTGSSSDDDERTNRAVEVKKKGTFSVGLASRNIEHSEPAGESDSEHEETCEYCAAEKAAANKARERNPAWDGPHHPRNLLLGVVYTAKYLGSSQIMSPQAPNKAVRMEQAQEAVGRIKVPEGEDQPTTDIDFFISTERLKVVNSTTKEVMLDHSLRSVSFIADIGDVLVLMARQQAEERANKEVLKPSQILASVGTAQTDHKNVKITCHVFQAPEAQVIAKSIGQAFNVAYQEFLRQNGLSEDVIEDAEYNGVLEAQKILGEDLSLLSDENSAKEVIVNKKPAEMLGVMIVESGWGSMIPCAIIAHLAKDGPAAKSGRLNVGDQILSVNGTSLVGLPLLECQNIIKNIRPDTKVVMKIVSCPPTVQVVVNRPDTKYQLGFSVQNGMICSLMRGSIAERGGVRVGHRIIEINNESVVATSHQHIVELLATTVGEIRMKTMPASMYRLLVGLETPQHI
ncbi:dentin sialophosphoprotein-like isoform X2 [Stylophora pistillata]|uniref:dentin sialophosphoprotein-like isoform X2 n=1 Tax=Stylophora pistillata TaxID=50429 RepID=UPI000C042F86|nr:dentin sialophosphoprotein-like isoform X2 [Stylophora pistillata]